MWYNNMVTFIKLEIEQITDERLDKLTNYHKLELVAMEEDLLVFRIGNK